MSQFNLFSCHKFLESSGASLLTKLAKCDINNLSAIEDILRSMAEFSERLKGHADWEDHFVFKLLPTETIDHEQKFHVTLDDEIDSIQKELECLQPSSLHNLHQIYLRFRKFYSELLSHFNDEETHLMKKLCMKLSEHELRQIDHEIYKSMSADDMVAMVKELFPPCNIGEKMAVLEDLKNANPNIFIDAWPKMITFFSEEERTKYLRKSIP